jgi:uncharacterized protein YdiU (UPF0061 family)
MSGAHFDLQFDDSFVRELPADPNPVNQRRQVYHAAYSRVEPTPVREPALLAHSAELAELLGLSEAACASPEFVQVFAGNRLLPGMKPYAACYGGHQFGNWAGQLGDGRAITLGEAIDPRGRRWDLQLKGAGPTPYSRTADGLAVLRSSLREFLCSEAMHHLGVPTTRALSLCTTGEQVVRDMFYDGHPKYEPGAVVCRVAPSFLRFGNFELPASRDDGSLLKAIADYTLRTHFPELGAPGPATYVAWFREVARRTVVMITHWMRVGFVHGVMNTDNMSVLGLTIDYGPYGFLDDYDPTWTPNTTDAQGRRYRYGHQPRIAIWNLSRLASAIIPLIGATDPLQAALDECASDLERSLREMMYAKLGLGLDSGADELIAELPALLAQRETDMTLFFRKLAELPADKDTIAAATDQRLLDGIADAYYAPDLLTSQYRAQAAAWLRRYLGYALSSGVPDVERRARMNAVNPKFVPRNYLAQLAIDRAELGDVSYLKQLMQVLREPYAEQPEHAAFAEKRPDWARQRPGCSMLSCSS